MKSSIKDFFPFFVLGFIILSFVRTIGDHLFFDNEMLDYWKFSFIFFKGSLNLLYTVFNGSSWITNKSKKHVKLWFKPLIIGFVASATVGVVSIVYLY